MKPERYRKHNRKKHRIEFEVPGIPVPQSRPRFTKNGHVYEDAKVREYKDRVARIARLAMGGREPMKGAFIASLTFFLPIPKSWSKKKKGEAALGEIVPTKRPDTDNLAKSVLDACNGIIYVDDSQVIRITAKKWYGDEPGVIAEFL